jgi:hypothetical protein
MTSGISPQSSSPVQYLEGDLEQATRNATEYDAASQR